MYLEVPTGSPPQALLRITGVAHPLTGNVLLATQEGNDVVTNLDSEAQAIALADLEAAGLHGAEIAAAVEGGEAHRKERVVPEALGQGNFAPLMGWLAEHVHAQASSAGFEQILAKATGEPLNPEAVVKLTGITLPA